MAEFRRWKVDFDQNTSGLVDRKPVADPPGYMSSLRGVDAGTAVVNQSHQDRLKQGVRAIYGRATGQLKNMGMMAFMMWMSGTQIQIFSIMMTANGIYQPIAAIANSGQMFSAELSEGGKFDVLKPRLLFILIQLGGLAFGLWKLAGMGLLPTHASDFVSTLSIPKALERSVPAIPFQ